MAKKERINKPKMLYLLVDSDGNPVGIEASYYSASLRTLSKGKYYNSAGVIVNRVSRVIKEIRDPDHYNSYYIKIGDLTATKEDLITAILALRIQCFEVAPTKVLDLTFYLDKIL